MKAASLAVLLLAAAPARAAVPDPVIAYTGSERYEAGGINWTRYKLDVVNKARFPAELFDASPELPPCGHNKNAARAWVDIHAADGKRMYGFCALGKPGDLGKLWVAVKTGEAPPPGVYIVINDRKLGVERKSNVVPLAPAARAASGAIDLHLHLLMDVSAPGLFRGRPGEDPSGVTDRNAKRRNQVSLKDLEAAGVRLVMATLHSPEALPRTGKMHYQALLDQIEAVEAWSKKQPRTVLVRTPEEAEKVLAAKEWRLGVILAAEGAHGVDTPERLDVLWDRGLRMLTVMHFHDHAWGGSAAVKYWPKSSCRPGGKPDENRNPNGLSEKGKALTAHAVKKGLLLDWAHASDKTVEDVAALHPKLPLIFSHEGTREYTPCERMVSPEQLRLVKKTGGLVGIMLGANYVGESLLSFMSHAEALAKEAGPDNIALGSDYNGFIRRIEGAAGGEGYALVLEALRKKGIRADRSAEAFVRLWRRVLGQPQAAVGAKKAEPARDISDFVRPTGDVEEVLQVELTSQSLVVTNISTEVDKVFFSRMGLLCDGKEIGYLGYDKLGGVNVASGARYTRRDMRFTDPENPSMTLDWTSCKGEVSVVISTSRNQDFRGVLKRQ